MDEIKAALGRIEGLLQTLVENTAMLTRQEKTKEARREAGKKSAKARAEKFGTARPPDSPREQTVLFPNKNFVREQKESTSVVWNAYREAFEKRYPAPPLRNVTVNSQCKALERQLGLEMACRLVAYYVGRSDAYYVNAKHPVGLCLKDAQKLAVEMTSGKVMTMAQARQVELDDNNKRAVQEYLDWDAQQEVT